MSTWRLHTGNCIDLLQSLPSDSIESMVTDPPAGIAFMGRDWDKDKGGRDRWIVWLCGIMREALRVLKPGAHALVWALPRTSHWTATALEDAGFEVRDVIVHLFGSGFPKSLNVAKAIDAHLGHEPTVIGTRTLTGNAALTTAEKGGTYGVGVGSAPPKEAHVTAPTSEEAQQWDGWGTALKPASEHWILVRKPLDGTVAGNTLAHGTGGLNIDACRIFTDWSERSEAWKASGHSAKPDAEKIAAPPGQGINCHPAGRWPANVLLEHADGCELVGMKRVRAEGGGAPLRGDALGYNGATTKGVTSPNPRNADGSEDVPDWRCVDGCPVRMLDEQSGELKSGGVTHQPRRTGFGFKDGRDGGTSVQRPPDSGGASRFFYVAKPSTAEREAGCDHLPRRNAGDLVDREEGSAGMANPRAGAGRTSSGRANFHPTVKPIELMRYLCRLITPPGGTVLDLFCGSGTTGCAAALEGFDFIGADLDADHIRIAEARIAHWARLADKQLSLFEGAA